MVNRFDVFARTSPSSPLNNDLIRLFEVEVPEIVDGIVEIKAIAREPGARSKVAVSSNQEGVDAVGACVGLRGIRIRNVVNVLGEKIDVIEWSEDPIKFISNSLSPAVADRVDLDEKEQSALVLVQEDEFARAIGPEGQNVRLTVLLTGVPIHIEPAVTPIEANVIEPETFQLAHPDAFDACSIGQSKRNKYVRPSRCPEHTSRESGRGKAVHTKCSARAIVDRHRVSSGDCEQCDGVMNMYPCDVTGGFHVGHRGKKADEAERQANNDWVSQLRKFRERYRTTRYSLDSEGLND